VGPLRVLVADDEAGIRHGIARALRHFTLRLPVVEDEIRFEVQAVDSGEAALEQIAAAPPDILLLDHKMGGITGIDVLEQLRDKSLDMLVVMITAFATIETAVRATKCGAFDFIAKPFTPEELKETLRKTASHLLAQRQARKLAEEKRRVRFDFIRVLGHELKAPLGAIENYLYLIKAHQAGPDVAAYDEFVDRCMARAEGMRKLIADLLDLTRIESGQKQRDLAEVHLGDIARGCVEAMQPAAAQRNISVHLESEGELLLTGDRGELEIILNNLVSNAVKYNRDGGSVHVRLQGEPDRILIEVADTGIGLAPEDAARLFHDFVRIRNEATRHVLGSGLGLSIVRKIAQLYDGTVGVESQPDAGSTFRVSLSRSKPSR